MGVGFADANAKVKITGITLTRTSPDPNEADDNFETFAPIHFDLKKEITDGTMSYAGWMFSTKVGKEEDRGIVIYYHVGYCTFAWISIYVVVTLAVLAAVYFFLFGDGEKESGDVEDPKKAAKKG